MIHQVLSDAAVSISDFKKNPAVVIAAAKGFPIAILNRNTPAAYLVSPEAWEAMLDRLDDIELVKIVKEREGGKAIPVDIEDLLNLDDI